MLAVRGLRKVFHPNTPNERVALRDVDLDIDAGEFVVVIGGNGAGKSTLLNVIAGDLGVDAGSIQVAGRDITALPTHRRAQWIARVFQDPSLGTAGSMSIQENLAISQLRGCRRTLGAGLREADKAHYAQVLEPLGLGLEHRLEARVDLLSGGQRQALSLLMSTIRRPEVLLLDEHTAALDPMTATRVMQATVRLVEESRLTTLMVTHNMQHAIVYGTRLLMMHQGRIVLDVRGEEKASLTIEALIERFHIADDKILLQS